MFGLLLSGELAINMVSILTGIYSLKQIPNLFEYPYLERDLNAAPIEWVILGLLG